MVEAASPVWFITGCSTGFGRTLTRAVLGRGGRVVATARSLAAIADLVEAHEESAPALSLDVTDAGQIAAAKPRFGRIDVLIIIFFAVLIDSTRTKVLDRLTRRQIRTEPVSPGRGWRAAQVRGP